MNDRWCEKPEILREFERQKWKRIHFLIMSLLAFILIVATMMIPIIVSSKIATVKSTAKIITTAALPTINFTMNVNLNN